MRQNPSFTMSLMYVPFLIIEMVLRAGFESGDDFVQPFQFSREVACLM